MSRIGRKEIVIPNNIEVKIDKSNIWVKGQRGELFYKISELIKIEQTKNTIKLIKKFETKKAQEIYGLSRSIINNMIIGVSEGFQKKLVIQGVGYRSQIKDNNLILNVGYSHTVQISTPKNISIKVQNNTNISIEGINKEQVGQIAATIRSVRPPEPYKGKGIRYENETIRRKVGKAGK
uniref:Large ribosomal subunit protein uL6c n=1 Tax=Ophidocladus simpliciusculus TaxID=1261574 RepID=A0A1Z1MJP3_9FLOR|nr:ribosomal protein L6 [Ophidocladus simpliciusculus]ARW66045.1 ribosomal protein L6 [Ophidocladus simpliciusculus]